MWILVGCSSVIWPSLFLYVMRFIGVMLFSFPIFTLMYLLRVKDNLRTCQIFVTDEKDADNRGRHRSWGDGVSWKLTKRSARKALLLGIALTCAQLA